MHDKERAMADKMSDNIANGFKDIVLAGVGALSLGGAKAKEVVDSLIERGQVSVEQGRAINEELKHKAVDGTSRFQEDALRAYADTLSKENRLKFATTLTNLADEIIMGEPIDVDVQDAADRAQAAEAADAE